MKKNILAIAVITLITFAAGVTTSYFALNIVPQNIVEEYCVKDAVIDYIPADMPEVSER